VHPSFDASHRTSQSTAGVPRLYVRPAAQLRGTSPRTNTTPGEPTAHGAGLVRPGVWCEALTFAGEAPDTAERRDAHAAVSADAAIRWMRAGVRAVTSSLGPLQAGYVLDHWVHGPGSLEDYARLRHGRPCSLTVYRHGLRLTWRARPVRFLRIALVNDRPPCTDRCRSRVAISAEEG